MAYPKVIQMLRDASTRKKTVAVCTDLHLRDRLGGMRRPIQVHVGYVSVHVTKMMGYEICVLNHGSDYTVNL